MAIFVTAALAGSLIVVVILILGSDHDIGVDHDVDLGADLDGGSPGVVSIKVISLAVCGWGVAGAIAKYHGATMWQSSLYGLIGAAILGAIGYLFLLAFYRSQASSTVTDSDYEGLRGRVITTIRENGLGEITCTVRGRTFSMMARSEDDKSIASDALIEVVRKVGNVVIVRKAV